MATRAKYTLVKAPIENNEAKLDTDILMRFSNSYGTLLSTQASTLAAPSLYSSDKARSSSPSRQPKS